MEWREPVSVSTPLGGTKLRFHRLSGTEQLARPFEYQLDLTSEDEQLPFADLLGRAMVVKLPLPGGGERFFHGLVSRFSQTGREGSHAVYRATLRPWVWFLSKTFDCRIFQDETAVDIVKSIFRDRGFTDFDEALGGSYSPLDYCVQYRESDFDFVSRLLEHEGIYYYFRHEKQKHTLVLCDSYSSHATVPGYEEVSYYPPSENEVRDEDHLWEWDLAQEVQSGAVTLNEFDFERPKAGLTVKSSLQRSHPLANGEVYDYPGNYLSTTDGESRARVRVEELQARFEEVSAVGNARGLGAGGLFTLAKCPREDQNREYLLVGLEHELREQEYRSTAGGAAGPTYKGKLRAIDAKEVFRPARLTPKPFVRGPQTAVVVGKAGEEIWTDKYGRVKVQFHWDRLGKIDENSSCWVRVSQPWAGKGWGAVAIPRIGQEVVVDFLEGDPDRPIITGRVYNTDNMPPNTLPDAAMVSGFKSNSTPGGGGSNEISADDTKGKEKVTIHAQYDMATTVENDQTLTVHNNRSGTVDVDDSETVGNNQTQTIGVDQTVSVGSNQSVTVGAAQSVTVGAGQTVSVGADQTESVGAGRTVSVGAADALSVGADCTMAVGASLKAAAGASVGLKSGADTKIVAGGPLEMEGATVTIKGATISLEGDTIKLVAGGSTVTLTGGSIDISSSGPVNVKGGLVKINGGVVQVNS